MTTIAEFTAPTDAFPLGSLFDSVPNASVELDRLVPANQVVFPYFWVWYADPHEVEDAIDDHPGLESVRLVDELDGGGLFRAQWAESDTHVVAAIHQTRLSILSATGTSDGWTFEVRAEEKENVAEFQQYCAENDVSLSLSRINSVPEMQIGGRYDLTPQQREALTLAYDEGYYDHPREATLEEIASQVGITRPSLSSRLRRGSRNLIENTLIHGQHRE